MTNLEIIRQACIKTNPSILDLKFGCEVCRYGDKKMVVVGSVGLDNWKENIKNSFKNVGLLKSNPKICGGELRIGDTRYRLSELLDYIRNEISKAVKEERNRILGLEAMKEKKDYKKPIGIYAFRVRNELRKQLQKQIGGEKK